MVKRVTLRKRNSYHTKSNKIRQVRTPGGRLVVHYTDKIAAGPQCRETKTRISGIARLRPRKYATLRRTDLTVSRAYGGVLTHAVVKDRIVRAFLTEEIKVIKKKMQQKKAK
jgi:large subunit ribosomal protein L34e